MQPGRWNDSPTQTVRTRITVNGVSYRGSARVDAQCFDGHPSKAGTSPAATCTLILWPPDRSTTALPPNPVISIFFPEASWPPNVGQHVTVDVGDGVRWWRVFTGRVDSIEGTLSDGSVQIECVDESVRLELRAPRQALHAWVTHGDATTWHRAPIDMQGSTLVDHAARAAGFHARLQPAWDATMYLPMVGSGHPVIGSITLAKEGLHSPNRTAWPDGEGGWQIGNKVLNVTFTPSPAPVEVTMDLPPRVNGRGWTVFTLRGAGNAWGLKRGPFIAYDHDQNVIRYGFRTSRISGVDLALVPTASVSVQGAPVPRGDASRVTLRFTPRSPTSTQHRFDVRTDTGGGVNVLLTDSSGDIEVGWAAERAEYFGAGPMGAVQAVGKPETSFAQLTAQRTARIRYAEVPWLDAARDLDDMTARDVLQKLAEAECGAFWVDRNSHLQYTGPEVREDQPVAATLTTDLDVIDWSWTYNHEQRAKRVRVNWLDSTWPSASNTLLWKNDNGGEGVGPGDLWEQIVSAEDDEDWLFVDTTSIQMYSDRERRDIIYSTTHGGTLTDDQGGEAWEAFQVSWNLERLGNRAVKWSAEASNSMPANQYVDFRIPTNATNLPQWWRGRALPRLIGSRIKWVEHTESGRTAANTGDEEYEHDAGWWVQQPERLTELRRYLQGELTGRKPIFDAVPVRADPRIDVGDRIYLLDEVRSGVRLDCVVLGVTGEWEDGKGSTSLKLRVNSASVTSWDAVTDAMYPPEPHWLQDQPSWQRAT